MIFNKLIIALTMRRFVENKLQWVGVKPDGPGFLSEINIFKRRINN
jgi:hypothetical protein